MTQTETRSAREINERVQFLRSRIAGRRNDRGRLLFAGSPREELDKAEAETADDEQEINDLIAMLPYAEEADARTREETRRASTLDALAEIDAHIANVEAPLYESLAGAQHIMDSITGAVQRAQDQRARMLTRLFPENQIGAIAGREITPIHSVIKDLARTGELYSPEQIRREGAQNVAWLRRAVEQLKSTEG